MNKSKLTIKVNLSSSTMDYSLMGISQEEMNVLKTEFTDGSYNKYKGEYAEVLYYPELEVLIYLLEKFEATKSNNYSKLLHSTCQELIPYLLNDGRVIVVGASHSAIYKSETEYIKVYQKRGDVLGRKKIPRKDFPIKRIDYLSTGEKIISQEIDPFIGSALTKILTPFDKKKYPYTPITNTGYLVNKNTILEKNSSYKKYRIFQIKNFERLQEKRKIDHQLIINRREGNDHYDYLNIAMCGRNYLGEDFITNIDHLIQKLPELANASAHLFDYSLKSLKLVEKYILYHLITDEFSDKIFLPLLAYFGQCILKKNENYNSEWKMRYDATYQSWTPDITINDHFLDIYNPILRMLDTRDDYAGNQSFLYSYL